MYMSKYTIVSVKPVVMKLDTDRLCSATITEAVSPDAAAAILVEYYSPAVGRYGNFSQRYQIVVEQNNEYWEAHRFEFGWIVTKGDGPINADLFAAIGLFLYKEEAT